MKKSITSKIKKKINKICWSIFIFFVKIQYKQKNKKLYYHIKKQFPKMNKNLRWSLVNSVNLNDAMIDNEYFKEQNISYKSDAELLLEIKNMLKNAEKKEVRAYNISENKRKRRNMIRNYLIS